MTVMVVGLFVGGMGVAGADAWHSVAEPLKTTGARFEEMEYRWEPAGEKHGAFRFRGSLRDSEASDGHNVYLEARAHRYGWHRFPGVQKKTVHVEDIVFDGATRFTNTADMRVCRDRGSLRPDNCSRTRSFAR
ncbi:MULTISPECIES: hypothetical protein [unclassified Streptomyces]|uniref:hypothetical protein n=1 Tax=unclassified Streptomyces TaxID=2593676 RepID=UPI001CB6D321|nr:MULTISPECIES: hypothetical protein [unclassified Streptomyces]MBD0709281.1 hypothetical protein [Streptomyces sp. CBMA291]MBD0712629.1 hypothetical protein [Streptomyces sp. CBMA370]